jgi:hypothetical protein
MRGLPLASCREKQAKVYQGPYLRWEARGGTLQARVSLAAELADAAGARQRFPVVTTFQVD